MAVTHTRQSEEDDLLVGELLGGVVVDGDTARGDLAGVLSPGDVTGLELVKNRKVRVCRVCMAPNWCYFVGWRGGGGNFSRTRT